MIQTNIYGYGAAVLLSVNLTAYRGNTPKNIIYVRTLSSLLCPAAKICIKAILKKHRFDLPAGIEHNPANWAKVMKAVQDALTQLRSKFKKSVRRIRLLIPLPLTSTFRSYKASKTA